MKSHLNFYFVAFRSVVSLFFVSAVLGLAILSSAGTAIGATTWAAYSDPTNAAVPEPRAKRVDTDRTRKLAFPTAQGHGKFADAGIGPAEVFTVHKVTNLNSSGPGSFSRCYMATGPRVCIFEVSGTIALTSNMLARAAQSKLYIAGQTSPGGVQFKVENPSTAGPLRSVTTSDMIIRFIKLRPGTSHQLSTNVQGVSLGGNLDWSAHDIMVDHISQQWGTDEGIAMAGVDRATLQWSLQSEPLACSTCRSDRHSEHDYGMFLVSNNRFTMFKNVLIGGKIRNPNIAANQLDMINNVIYNYGKYATQLYVNIKVSVRANILGNWYSRGPRTGTMFETGQRPHCLIAAFEGKPGPGLGFEFYLNGNVCPHDLTGTRNMETLSGGKISSPILYQKGILTKPDGTPNVLFNTARNGGTSVPTTKIVSAKQATADVLSFAGALRDMHKVPRRDEVDKRAISQLVNCADRSLAPQPTSLRAVPAAGYPDLATDATWSWVKNDTDQDGMLDSWELSFPKITSLKQLKANGDFDRDGWSDLEEFLNDLAGDDVNRVGKGNLANVPPAYCGYQAP